jgi:hypothetical protein
MPRPCSICTDLRRREATDAAIVAKVPFRRIASQANVSEAAVRRHAKRHVPAMLTKVAKAAELVRADGLLEQLRDLHAQTVAVLTHAEKAHDRKTVLKAVRESRENLTLLARLLGQLGPGGAQATATVNVTPPEVLRVQALDFMAAEVRQMPEPLKAMLLDWLRNRRDQMLAAEIAEAKAEADAALPALPPPNGAGPPDALPAIFTMPEARTREKVLRRAERAGWPHLVLRPGLAVLPEPDAWRRFAATAGVRDLGEVLEALRDATESSNRPPPDGDGDADDPPPDAEGVTAGGSWALYGFSFLPRWLQEKLRGWPSDD